MKKWIGGIVLALVVIIGIFLFGFNNVEKSFIRSGESRDKVLGLSSNTEIFRDEDGITYISADGDLDAMTALGYAHAQDRLWQMEMMRRAGEGRLSEVYGAKTIGYDVFLRTVGFMRVAKEIWKEMPDKTKRALIAYSNGVNAFIISHKNKLPIEFDALNISAEPWKPIHSILISRLLAWELNTAFWSDLVLEQIKEKVDSVKFNDILPYYPSYAPTIIPGGQKPEPLLEIIRVQDSIANIPKTDTTKLLQLMGKAQLDSLMKENAPLNKKNKVVRSRKKNLKKQINKPSTGILGIKENEEFAMNDVIEMEKNMREFLGIAGSHVGSNSWAIAGSRTQSGKPILANDPHLEHSAPSKWYQIVIAFRGKRLAGVTLPGIPFVVIGRNNYIAWGITNMMADETDFYIEQADSAVKNYVIYDGKREPLTVLQDTIRVKDTLGVPCQIRISKHGPIISDCHPFTTKYQMGESSFKRNSLSSFSKKIIAMRWRGNDVSQDISAFQWINEARNLDEFAGAVRLGGCPGLNFTYASQSGTIAYIPSVRVPIRLSGVKSILPFNGADSRYDWKDAIPMVALPTLVNPPSGVVATANNKLTNDPRLASVGDLWEDPSRATRLAQLMREGKNFNLVRVSQMQSDITSPQMIYMNEFLLRAFPDSLKQGYAIRDAMRMLRNWKGGMSADSPEAAIVAYWFQRLIELTFKDELGDTLYSQYIHLAQSPIKALRQLTMLNSTWFDNVNTVIPEHREDIMRKALSQALDSLHKFYGNWQMTTWRFGDFHTLTFKHTFHNEKGIQNVVDIGPINLGGCNTTLANAEWDFNKPFDVKLGASMRLVVDFSDTTNFIHNIITTGSSGQPISSFYKNQTSIWSAGGLLGIKANPPEKSSITSTTLLEPIK